MPIQFGEIKDGFNPSDAYGVSFGALPDRTVYANLRNKMDMRPDLKTILEKGMQSQFKALSTTSGGAGTAGQAMVPVYVDPRIVDTTRKYTPLVEAIARVTNRGITADYNKVTAKAAAQWLREDGAISGQTDTYDRASTDIKFLYSKGRVTGVARASYPSYMLEGFQPTGSGLAGTSFSPQAAPNAKQLDVVMKARAIREKEEATIVNGAVATTEEEFDGIVALQSTTNVTDKSSAALEYDDIETAIQAAFDDSGRPSLAVASSSVLADLRKIMIDTFNYRPSDMTVKLPFGVSSHLVLETMVGPVPVIPSQNLSNTTGAKQIFFLDMDFIEMRVLQDLTYEDLAKTSDAEEFMLKIYECLIMKNTAFNSFIDNIA